MRLKKWRAGIAGIMLAGAMIFGQCVAATTDCVVASAAESQVTFGTAGTVLEKGKTYIVPLALKNANNLSADSAAKDCPGKYGVLRIDESGKATLQVVLRSVSVGTATDYAYNFKVYQEEGAKGTPVDATIDSTQDVIFKNGDTETPKTVPAQISFAIPAAVQNADGVYLNMYVDAMGYAPDAFLQIDYANAKLAGDAALNYTTDVTKATVEQFGNYDVNVKVSVADGRIADVDIEGTDFKGTYAEDNETYLSKAINGTKKTAGMKQKLIGLYCNDTDKLNNLDAVSGATYSSNAIKEATMNALGVKINREVIPDAPTAALAPGLYTVELKDRTDVVDHGLVGPQKKATGYIRVDENGKMYLTYRMVSGTKEEPLYVLGYNGYYKNNDTKPENLTTEGVTYDTEQMEVPTVGKSSVVTNITVPLDGLRQTYINNVYLYVEAMKNLNGTVSGVDFDHGKFNINSTVTLYWDTLENVSDKENTFAALKDGVYCVTGTMEKPDKSQSMSNSAINHNVKLTVKDGVYYATMDFNSMKIGALSGYLSRLKYYEMGYTEDKHRNPQGSLRDVRVDNYQTYTDNTRVSDAMGSDYPNQVTFPLIPETIYNGGYVPLQVYVPIMESITPGTGTQNVYLKLDWSTVRTTTEQDEAFLDTEPKKENPDKSVTPPPAATTQAPAQNATTQAPASDTTTQAPAAGTTKAPAAESPKTTAPAATTQTPADKKTTPKKKVSLKPELVQKLLVKQKKKTVNLSWKTVKNADGYQILRADKAQGKWKTVKWIKSATQVKYADKKVKSGKTYTYKIRAYKIVQGKKVFGKYTSAKMVKIRK